MSKAKPFYDAFSDIKDEYINDAISYNASKKSRNAGIIIEAVACIVIICGFIGLSVFLKKVSLPENPVSSSTDTNELTENISTENDGTENDGTENDGTENDTPDTETDELPETVNETTENPPKIEMDDKFFIKLYVAVHNCAKGVTPYGEHIPARYSGIGRNPDRVSNELPGIEALNLKEIMSKDEVHSIIGSFAGTVYTTDDDLIFLWDFETPDGYTFCISAHFLAVEDRNDWEYKFEKYQLARLKLEVLKAELQNDGISAEQKEEYEKMLSELYLECDEYSYEYCKKAVEFAELLSGYELPESNDPEYATELINTVVTSLMDYQQNKQAYTDIDADDNLKRMVNEGFILEDICNVISQYDSISDIMYKISALSERIKIRTNEYRRVHEISPYIEYDYLLNYGKNEEYSEYIRVSERFKAVFYYKEVPGRETLYSLMFKEDDGGVVKELTPDIIRRTAVPITEFENNTGIKIEFEYDRAMIDVYIDVIYSHPGTTETTFRIGKTVNEKGNEEASKRLDELGVEEIYGSFDRYGLINSRLRTLQAKFIYYEFKAYPEEYAQNGDNKSTLTKIMMRGDELKVCGISSESSFDEFEEVFAALGFKITRSDDDITASACEGGLNVNLVKQHEISGKTIPATLYITMPPICRTIVYF